MDTMKTRVLKLEEPVEAITSAYIKLLREKDKTKRVYDVDPYVEVYRFRDNVYALLTDTLDGMGAPWMFLIIGPEKALLIDTSFGLGNLKGLVNELTGGMPVVVVNTHTGVDHSYGNYQFDRVHVHEYCVPYLVKRLDPHVWDYLFNDQGKCPWTEFDRQDLIAYKEYEIVGCKNGHVFNLGGDYDVELIFLPGHQAGHAGFLDRPNRILFGGSAFNSMRIGMSGPKEGLPHGEYGTVTALCRELEKLVARMTEFDAVFPSHGILDLDNSVVQNLLDACQAVIANPNDYDFLHTVKGKTWKLKAILGLGTLGYNDRSV